MGSGLPAIPNAARTIVKSMSPQLMRRTENLGMTPRQQELNWLWSFYCTCQYDARKVAWDGSEIVDRIDAEAIATAGVLPGGFYDAGQDFPLKFRKPAAPYHLARVIPNRFTGLLFSESQHPKLRCTGDPLMEDYVTALAEAGRLWSKMIEVRNFGGATGSGCISFKFVDGQLRFEVHDPRWVEPTFKDLETKELKSIDKRYMYPEYQLNGKQEYEQVWYWSRRIIDEDVDVRWSRVPVGEGDEPNWDKYKPDAFVKHGFGFFPGRWIQNKPVNDAVDGEPDCLGTYEQIEEMDALISQATRGTKANCDPTLHVATDFKLAELRKGSGNAIKTEKGGTAGYIELQGTGPKTAMEQAMQLRELILEVTQCVLDNPDDGQAKTAYEVRMNFASMMSNCDILREQYGQQGVLAIMNDVVRAIRVLSKSQLGAAPDGGPLRQVVRLPPRVKTEPDGQRTYETRQLPAEDQSQGVLELQWPPYFPPSLKDGKDAADAVKSAKDAGAIDDEHAVRYCAPYFGIEDVPAALLKIKAEEQERQKEAEERAKEAFAARGGF